MPKLGEKHTKKTKEKLSLAMKIRWRIRKYRKQTNGSTNSKRISISSNERDG
jgi:hypothetical protein